MTCIECGSIDEFITTPEGFHVCSNPTCAIEQPYQPYYNYEYEGTERILGKEKAKWYLTRDQDRAIDLLTAHLQFDWSGTLDRIKKTLTTLKKHKKTAGINTYTLVGAIIFYVREEMSMRLSAAEDRVLILQIKEFGYPFGDENLTKLRNKVIRHKNKIRIQMREIKAL